MKRKKTPVIATAPTKLDISFGPFVMEGYTRPEFDVKNFSIKVPDESVEEIYSAHLMQRFTGNERPAFMDEMYRILKIGGKLTIVAPYWTSARSIQDFMHQWPPIVEQSFLYFNKNWREQAGAKDYPVKCDFDFTYGYAYEQETTMRSDETKPHWVKHYVNAVNDIQVVLTKRKES